MPACQRPYCLNMVILEFPNNFKIFPISCWKKWQILSPKNHIAWKFGNSFDTNYVMCRNVEICKLIKQISKKNILWRKNKISLGTFHNVLFFEHEIFKINKLFGTRVKATLELCTMVSMSLEFSKFHTPYDDIWLISFLHILEWIGILYCIETSSLQATNIYFISQFYT